MFRPHSGGKYPSMQRLIAATLLVAFLTAGAASAQTRPPQPVDSDLAYWQRVEERLSGVDYQMRGLTGQVEQLQFRLRQAETRIKKLSAELAKVKAERSLQIIGAQSLAVLPGAELSRQMASLVSGIYIYLTQLKPI